MFYIFLILFLMSINKKIFLTHVKIMRGHLFHALLLLHLFWNAMRSIEPAGSNMGYVKL